MHLQRTTGIITDVQTDVFFAALLRDFSVRCVHKLLKCHLCCRLTSIGNLVVNATFNHMTFFGPQLHLYYSES